MRGRPVRMWPVMGTVLALLWLFLRGVALSPDRLVGEFLIGLVIGLPVAYASRRFYPDDTDVVYVLRAIPYAVLYVVVFLRDLVVANLDVAYRVLLPSMPIDPVVVVVPLRVRKDVAITTIANSITLTPGTLTMDYDADHNALLVHALVGRDPEALVAPIRRWEDYALVIFDEELKPGDSPPEIPVVTDGRPGDDNGGTDGRRPDAGGGGGG